MAYSSTTSEHRIRFLIVILFILIGSIIHAQEFSKTRFVYGLSSPEMLHLGFSTDLTAINQLGVSFGFGPSWGMVWTSMNIEHRLYLTRGTIEDQSTKYFIRQGFTDYPEGDYAIGLTFGADLKSKKLGRGWTIDAGIYFLNNYQPDGFSLIPALRFQRRTQIKKSSS